ncbi:DUF6529 family protein [Luedemannella flava]|uniref:DUF6529 family protein n=1 Tax=Luedemannella flava TaxID=349316 RepID=UPI003CD05A24
MSYPAHTGPPTEAAPAVGPERTGAGALGLLVPFVVGGAVSLTLGVYGRLHTPTGIAVNVAGFSSPQTVKVWLATGAFVLALVQLLSALLMWGRVPGVRAVPRGTAAVHRWSGRAAFLLAVPVAIHCLYALGAQAYDTRVLVHSLVGCLFFGAFATKMLALPRRNLPGWALPVLGGTVFTALVALWLTSSLWFFTTVGVTF